MNDQLVHDTFVIERTYPVPPARVFAAWADPAIKSRWFAGPDDWDSGIYSLDFRVGGHERTSGGPKGEPVHYFDAEYRDIVPNERFVTTYVMHKDETLISVSVATLVFEAVDGGTRMTMTEQGTYLDGPESPMSRLEGTKGLLDALGAELARDPANA
jgi:uncharacterized protein YndB with AHSA1/START domain